MLADSKSSTEVSRNSSRATVSLLTKQCAPSLQYAAEGCNYGEVTISDNQVVVTSVVSKRPIFDFKLDTVALCVVPTNNRDEVEVQFVESEKADKNSHEDTLVQMTFHFPTGMEEEDEEGASAAEVFQRRIMDTGVIRSVTGDIIAEFSKEQGNFVTPRGKYAIQVRIACRL
jgi:hypothetical protein